MHSQAIPLASLFLLLSLSPVTAQPPIRGSAALDHVRTAAQRCGIQNPQITLAAGTSPRGERFQTVHVTFPRPDRYAMEGIRAFLEAIEKGRPGLRIREVDFGGKDQAGWRLRTVSVAIVRPNARRIASARARLQGFLTVCDQEPFRRRVRVQKLRVTWSQITWDMTFASQNPQRTMQRMREALQSRLPNVASCTLGPLGLQGRLRLGCVGSKLTFQQRWGPTAEEVGAQVVTALGALAPRAQGFALDGQKLSFTLSVLDERALVQSLEAIRGLLKCDGYYLRGMRRGPAGLTCTVLLTLP